MIPKCRKKDVQEYPEKSEKEKQAKHCVQSASSVCTSLKIRQRSGQCQVNTAAVWCRQARQRHNSYNRWAGVTGKTQQTPAVPTRHTRWDKSRASECIEPNYEKVWREHTGIGKTHILHISYLQLYGDCCQIKIKKCNREYFRNLLQSTFHHQGQLVGEDVLPNKGSLASFLTEWRTPSWWNQFLCFACLLFTSLAFFF